MEVASAQHFFEQRRTLLIGVGERKEDLLCKAMMCRGGR
jgi:hypothetical protein